jgi:dolichol-phosphate mannosyltransferase
MRITVVLPAYNEARDLPPLLDRIGTSLTAARCDFRILVVDDGSADATAECARRATAWWPVDLVQHPRNMGLGAAMRTGLRAAAEVDGVVATMDADNSHDPALIPAMLRTLEDGFDVVIASRFQPGGREIGVAPHRRLLSHAAGFMLGAVVRYPGVRDYTCGYRLYRADVLRRLIDVFGPGFIREDGFACMLELLLNLKAVGARVAEVPLVLRYDLKRGASKMRVLRTVRRYGVVIARAPSPQARLAGASR